MKDRDKSAQHIQGQIQYRNILYLLRPQIRNVFFIQTVNRLRGFDHAEPCAAR